MQPDPVVVLLQAPFCGAMAASNDALQAHLHANPAEADGETAADPIDRADELFADPPRIDEIELPAATRAEQRESPVVRQRATSPPSTASG